MFAKYSLKNVLVVNIILSKIMLLAVIPLCDTYDKKFKNLFILLKIVKKGKFFKKFRLHKFFRNQIKSGTIQ